MRKGILSLEELDIVEAETVEVDPNMVVAIDDHVGGVEETLGDADNAIAEMAEHEEGVAEATDVAETLDAIGDSVEETIPEGGMDERETRRLAIAVEHLYNRVNMPAKRRTAMHVSAEAYSTRESRIIATQEAFDEIKANAKALGKKIMEAIKKIIEMAKAIFERLFSATEQQRARAEKLGKAAANLRGKSASSADGVKLPNSAAVLKVDGKMLQGNALIAKFEEHTKNKAIDRDYFKFWDESEKQIAKSLADKNITGDDFSKLLLSISSFSGGKVIEVDGKMRSSVSLAFGNQELVLTYRSGEFGTMTAGIDGPALAVDGAEVKPLTVEQCEKLTKLVDEHLARYKGTPGILGQLSNGLSDIGNKIAGATDGTMGVLMPVVHGARTATFGAGIAARRYDAAVCKAILDVVAGQLALIGAPEKAASKADPVAA